jgi:superfamily II DNA or RNA helicase/intein/homing endonuclease
MVEIHVNNHACFIVGSFSDDPFYSNSVHNEIKKALSYKVPNHEWSEKYKQGIWDGTISIYNRKLSQFPTGLLYRVIGLLNELNVEHKIIDNRKRPKKVYPLTLDLGNRTLRDYQKLSAEKFAETGTGILALATGAGKTLTSCYLFTQIQTYPVVFIVPALELLNQTQKEFEKYLRLDGKPVKVGKIGGGVVDINMEGINVCTYQTILTAYNKKYNEKQYKIVESKDGEGPKSTEQLQKELNLATKKWMIAEKNAKRDLSKLSLDMEKASEIALNESDPKKKKSYASVALTLGKQFNKEFNSLIKVDLAAYKKAQSAWDNRQNILYEKAQVRELISSCKGFIVDEAHLAAVVVEELRSYAQEAFYCGGMSVDANSLIELKGGIFLDGFIGTIQDAFKILLDSGYKINKDKGYEYILLDKVVSRGWNGTNFDWKPVKTIIRHNNTKPSRWIKVGGSKLGLTDDHSVFTVDSNLDLIEQKSSFVKVNDIMAYDNGHNWNTSEYVGEDIINILLASKLNPNKIRLATDLSHLTHNDLNMSYKAFWGIKRSKYGHSVNLSQYQEYKDILPKPTKIYTEAAHGIYLDSNIKMNEIAYLLGFYVGDGWIHENKIVFAVENARLDEFLEYINNLSGIKCNPKIRTINPGSVEVHISHCVLTSIFKYYFDNMKCHNKRIPSDWIFNWDETSRRELLKGLIDSDGCYNLKGTKRSYTYTTTSKNLSNDIICLIRSLNVMPSLSITKPRLGGIINGRQIVGKNDIYRISFSAYSLEGNNTGFKGKPTKYIHEYDDFIEARVKNIIDEPISEYVYDLEMEGHPSFVANGILVHNSATPYRTDNQEIRIEGALGGKIYEVSNSDLIDRKFLVPPKIFMVEIEEFSTPQTYADAYDQNIVNSWERNYRIKQFAESFKEAGLPVLILVERREHGFILESMIEDAVFVPGGDKGEIDPTDEEKNYRRRMLNSVENNEIVLIATQWANTGVDAPKIATLIIAGSCASPVTTYQQVGRVLRCVGRDANESTLNGKPYAVVIDFYDQHKNLKTHSNMRKRVYRYERSWDFKMIKAT